MRSDYIVPEGDGRRGRRGAWLLLFALIVTLLLYGLGQREPARQSAGEPNEVALLVEAPAKDRRSLLQDLAPIGAAEAKAAEPRAPQPLLDLPRPASAAADQDFGATPAPPASAPPAAGDDSATLQHKRLTVQNGDSLSLLFDRHKLRPADWIELSRLSGEARKLQRLHPGDTLEVALDDAGRVQQLAVRIDDLRTLEIARDASGAFESTVRSDEVEHREVVAQGEISTSLFLSAKDAGLSDRLIMEFADIYAWDVDFVLDIRQGDRFTLVYEEIYRNGEKLKEGKILAAEFHNRGRVLQALRYVDENGRSGYYNPDGEPMRKAFLRSPVDFTRISSRFSLARKHPVLNRIRAHRGVDYAAGRGTPIRAAGDGKVIFAGPKGGYGNVVILQHAGKYTTLYAHMDNFRRGIRRGSSVNQGQTIGYVGSSGLATGPHLHYEFRINDRHVDPLKVELPSAPKIAASKLPRFKAQTEPLLAKLEQLSDPTVVAEAR